MADLHRYKDALENTPREEGEDVCAWLQRVCASVIPRADRQLPPGDRDPGEDE